MVQRTCSKCGVSKPETEEFFRRRGTAHRGGLRPDCRECSAKRDREYHQRHYEKIQAQRAVFRQQNRDRIAAAEQVYARTPAGKAARARASARWTRTESGRERNREAQHRRRVALIGAISDLTDQDWADALAFFGQCCAYCGASERITKDHVVPIHSGGHHTRSNVVPCCKSCNSSKFHHEMTSWFVAQPFFDPTRLARIRDYMRGGDVGEAGAA